MVFAPREHVDDANTPEHGGRDGAATRHLRWSMWQVTPAAPMGSTGEKACPIYATLNKEQITLCTKARGCGGETSFVPQINRTPLSAFAKGKAKSISFHMFTAFMPS